MTGWSRRCVAFGGLPLLLAACDDRPRRRPVYVAPSGPPRGGQAPSPPSRGGMPSVTPPSTPPSLPPGAPRPF